VSEIGRSFGERPPDEPGPLTVNERASRWLRRHLAGSTTVLTTTSQGGYRGATVSTCFVASNSPFLVAVSLERDSQMKEWVAESRVFAVSILPWREKLRADQFAGFIPLASPTFEGIDHRIADSGAPVLTGCIGWADCRLEDSVVTGDHTLVIGGVVACGIGAAVLDEPLIYYGGRYLRVG
jgi:flavin reductase (DIM6/NTAB) family NADH-FMN oxidoreductase RutF